MGRENGNFVTFQATKYRFNKTKQTNTSENRRRTQSTIVQEIGGTNSSDNRSPFRQVRMDVETFGQGTGAHDRHI